VKWAAQGASLLECTVYLLIAVLATNLCCISLHTGYRFLLDHTRRARELAALHAAADLWARDLRYAWPEAGAWYVTQSAELIWQQEKQAISWLYEKDTLWRVTGRYDAARGSWSKRARVRIAPCVKECRLVVRRNPMSQEVRAVELTLAGTTEAASIAVALRNGRRVAV